MLKYILIMNTIAHEIERDPALATAAFNGIENGLNLVLPGSEYHSLYREVGSVGLALVVDYTDRPSYNPLYHPDLQPAFMASNQDICPQAWGEIAPEFLEGEETKLGRFSFFAFAKTENMRLTGASSSYDPDNTVITPGRVGFAGGRKFIDTYVTTSGLWEVHDHLVARVFHEEVNKVISGESDHRTAEEFAELFERNFDGIQSIHDGIAAEDIAHSEIGYLLSQTDELPTDF